MRDVRFLNSRLWDVQFDNVDPIPDDKLGLLPVVEVWFPPALGAVRDLRVPVFRRRVGAHDWHTYLGVLEDLGFALAVVGDELHAALALVCNSPPHTHTHTLAV